MELAPCVMCVCEKLIKIFSSENMYGTVKLNIIYRNIKIVLSELEWEITDWMYLDQDSNCW